MKSYEEYYMEFMDSLFNKNKQKSDKESIKWKVAFFILLVVNLICLSNIFLGKWLISGFGDYVSQIFNIVGSLVFLSIIDLIAFFFYVRTQHPHGHHGTTRVIGDAVLILAIFGLFTAGVIIYTIFGLLGIFGFFR